MGDLFTKVKICVDNELINSVQTVGVKQPYTNFAMVVLKLHNIGHSTNVIYIGHWKKTYYFQVHTT